MAADVDPDLPAGDFSRWLAGFEEAMTGATDADVPCGTCTACCTSSQFVHVEPDEADALAHIPAELLFPAPRLPLGHLLLGFDEHGHCPLLVEGACSIYEHRPRTCRTYDCRVLPAAGITLDDPTKAAIAERAQRWRFDHPTDHDTASHAAVQAAAAHLEAHPEALPEGAPSPSTAARAALAVSIHRAFLGRHPATGGPAVVEPTAEAVGVSLARRRPGRSP